MNIITETINWLQNLRQDRIVEVNGLKYTDRNLCELEPVKPPPHPTIEHVLTLTGLIDYILLDPDEQYYPAFVLIESYKRVSYVTTPYGDTKSRYVLARAEHSSWYNFDGSERGGINAPVETAIVTLLTCFEPSEDREHLLDLISNIRVDDETRIEDDGLTQRVAVKTGVTTVESVTLSRLVTLRPRVTFPEIDQPNIVYAVRLKQEGERSVRVRLQPQEDFGWHGDVVDAILKYLNVNGVTQKIIR